MEAFKEQPKPQVRFILHVNSMNWALTMLSLCFLYKLTFLMLICLILQYLTLMHQLNFPTGYKRTA